MSKEVQIVAWCDGEHDHREIAMHERRESFGSEPVVLDLCAACNVLFEKDLDTVRAWLARGVPVAKAQQAPEPDPPVRTRKHLAGMRDVDLESEVMRTCPDCGRVSPSRSALGAHLRLRHGRRLRDYAWPV